ncbi:hypothetical protein TNCV_2409921 [Trichonephila clavipes]|nr:hypothetical protein TNCV_2409921 [Trichonephila clavipes]
MTKNVEDDVVNEMEKSEEGGMLSESSGMNQSSGAERSAKYELENALFLILKERVILVAVTDSSIFSLFLRMVLIVEFAKFDMGDGRSPLAF